jgi:Na+-transporting NADH:ubiquinone oxidoreductase subunit NqrF
LFYTDLFEDLAAKHQNFTFETALSSPLDEDGWTGHTGFIHEVVLANALENHANIGGVEFYLCGPPMMVKACTKMLSDLGVPPAHISYDEF